MAPVSIRTSAAILFSQALADSLPDGGGTVTVAGTDGADDAFGDGVKALLLFAVKFLRILGQPIVHRDIQDLSNLELSVASGTFQASLPGRRETPTINDGLHALHCSAIALHM